MCEEIASSQEHVPPRNLFPKSCDVNGVDYRKDLITVPSCQLHNSDKSHDDEFLMISLAGIIGNNSVGYIHRFGKVDRAIRRRAGSLLNAIFKKRQHIQQIEIEENKFIEIIWGTPDVERLHKCFDHIARGLFFHNFNIRFQGNTKVHLGYLHYEHPSPRNFTQFIKDKVEIELKDTLRCGANQDVFFYQFTDKDKFNFFLIRLCFYGGLNTYVAFLPDDVETPKNLAFELINRGVKTIVKLDDKQYEIN